MNIRQILRPGTVQQTAMTERKQQAKSTLKAGGPNTDRLSWSKQALRYIDEQNRRVWEDKDNDENEDPQWKAFKKDMRRQDKCLKIAARVRNGDKVPPEDLRYLEAFDRAGYILALASRKPKPDPKKHDTLLAEEDLKDLEESTAIGVGGVAPVSVPDHSVE